MNFLFKYHFPRLFVRRHKKDVAFDCVNLLLDSAHKLSVKLLKTSTRDLCWVARVYQTEIDITDVSIVRDVSNKLILLDKQVLYCLFVGNKLAISHTHLHTGVWCVSSSAR